MGDSAQNMPVPLTPLCFQIHRKTQVAAGPPKWEVQRVTQEEIHYIPKDYMIFLIYIDKNREYER